MTLSERLQEAVKAAIAQDIGEGWLGGDGSPVTYPPTEAELALWESLS